MNLSGLWYQRSALRWLLWPLSILYQAIASERKKAFLTGGKPRYRAPVPVIIVGNITAGGAGKTPLVIAVTQWLQRQGWTPGVISRGYKAGKLQTPLQITASSSASEVGDEPLLIFERTGVPVYVFPIRQSAIKAMLQEHGVDILVCDDGLQHYALHRDIEIAVVDAVRLHGNGLCLPAGPLREPVSRLKSVDFTVYNGWHDSGLYYTSQCSQIVRLSADSVHTSERISIDEMTGRTIHAVAGIGFPKRFFDMLRACGLSVIEHPFADHHKYQASELYFSDSHPIIMTEKDAVKCRALDIDFTKCWHTVLDITLSDKLVQSFSDRVMQLQFAHLESPNSGSANN